MDYVYTLSFIHKWFLDCFHNSYPNQKEENSILFVILGGCNNEIDNNIGIRIFWHNSQVGSAVSIGYWIAI